MRSKLTRWMACLFLMVWTAFGATVLPALAEETPNAEDNDPARGISRPLNIDDAWVENALYIFSFVDNDFSAGHSTNFMVEGDYKMADDFGIDMALPALLLTQPLGSGPSAWGPIVLHLKYVPYQFGTVKSETSGLWTLQTGAGYSSSNSQFPGLGSSWSGETIGALRFGRVFVQENFGYIAALDSSALNSWFSVSSLGCSLDSQWVLQWETDFTGNTYRNDGTLGSLWTFFPQVGFTTGDWFLELGVELNSSPSGTTELLVERDL